MVIPLSAFVISLYEVPSAGDQNRPLKAPAFENRKI
jgi:hypothetical protein